MEDRRRQRCGAGSPTTPSSTSSTTARPIPGHGTPSSGRATTSGRRDSSRATPATGEARWFYQMSPHDLHDYDGVNENVLVDLPIDGTTAQGARPSRSQRLRLRDGSRDRRGAVGNAVRVGQRRPPASTWRRGACTTHPRQAQRSRQAWCATSAPPSPGGKDWQPSACSPRTRLLYIPHQNLCQDAGGHRR